MIGNHLLQHHSLSLVAIGLAGYIQSLPAGARIGIKRLTERFREGEVRISGALRELEEYGYLERSRVRLASGQVVTRTVSYDHPAAKCGVGVRPSGRGREAGPGAVRSPGPLPGAAPDPGPQPDPVPPPDGKPMAVPVPVPEPGPDPEQEPEPEHGPERDPEPVPGPVRLPEASALLARLRGDDPRLLLSDRDVRKLAPGVAEWLERGADPAAVRFVLTSGLPGDLRHPASLIAHRLKAWIPPHLPAAAPVRPAERRDPLQNCDGCDRAFRAPAPGRCRACPPVVRDEHPGRAVPHVVSGTRPDGGGVGGGGPRARGPVRGYASPLPASRATRSSRPR
ncbi:helix-turn-helix domain-containing protein [Streptomyces sp. NPDC006450]|uniref:helix-turn-helix domain-containing protein n=1 Tax=Streptomyces sp. NPDC006450 TaxID=3155458 RepID=UPI0033A93D40